MQPYQVAVFEFQELLFALILVDGVVILNDAFAIDDGLDIRLRHVSGYCWLGKIRFLEFW